MPKKTYGPAIQKRVKRLLAALLCFAAGEVEEDNFKIEHDWKEEDSVNPKLTIKTTLMTLELLTQKYEHPGKLTKAQIREALNLLKDFVKILEDNRTKTKGSDDWHFTLKLWSRDREKNLKRFDEIWESKRPKKSITQDEDVAVVPQTKLAIFQAPPLPSYFVERPEYSDDLKTRLLTGNRTLVITAIHGLGSVGKSTLAAALAHNIEIQTRFCDGILWATLGQQPDVLSLLSGWVQALRDYSFKPTSIEATSTYLRTLLYDKAVLLVVDDAWNTRDAQAFNVGGVRCQVLVTTREGAIADALAASTYSLDIMTPDQSMELLTKKLRREIISAERYSAENLAKGVGYLPLALELAAAEVASGTTWDELLADIQQEVARLKSFDRPEAEEITDEASLKRLSLTASLNLSVKRMPLEKQQHFAWLGVLPEDVTINKMMAATLWEMDERDAAKTLQYLRNKALLLTGVELADGTPTYRLHDLFHDLACNLLTTPPLENPSPRNVEMFHETSLHNAPFPSREGRLGALGVNLADAHAAFLEKYRQKTQNNLWHTLPNDGYIHQHLVWHLEKAGQIEEIHSLLREESVTGNNGWFEVREKLGQTGGYITDISRAWELAEKNWTEATLPQVVGLQCRYALMMASLNSLAANLPAKLLSALVKNKFWTSEQGLAYALQNPEPDQKVSLLVAIVNYLPLNLQKLALQKALAAAKLIAYEGYCAAALKELADILPSELFMEALTVAYSIKYEWHRATVLSALASKLPPKLLPEVLAAARAIQDEIHRIGILIALAGRFPEILPEALAVAYSIKYESHRAFALSALASNLPQEFCPEAKAAARAIQNKIERVKVLKSLAVKLPPELLAEALVDAKLIQDKYERTKALTTLAETLPDILPEALTAAKSIQRETHRVTALKALVAILPQDLLPEVLAAANSIQSEHFRADVLIALVDKLPSELLPEMLIAVRAIQHGYTRANVLTALANKRPELLLEALAAVRVIQDEEYCINTLRALAYKLPSELLPEILITAARAMEDEVERANALKELADKRPELLPEALAAARAIQNKYYRTNALSALADKLPQLLPEALAVARSSKDQYERANALKSLVDKLPEVLPEALAASRSIDDEDYHIATLIALADKLPLELWPEVLEDIELIEWESDQADVLKALADKMPPEFLPKALATTRWLSWESRADVLSALAGRLPDLLPGVLAIAKSIEDEEYLADILKVLAEKLPAEFLAQVLSAARRIQSDTERAKVLSALYNKIPEILSETLTTIRLIEDEYYRTNLLITIANKVPEVLPEVLTTIKLSEDEEYCVNTLKTLANKLSSAFLPEALAVAKSVEDESHRADALSALASGMSKMPSVEIFLLWKDLIHHLSLRTRPNLLSDIKALVTVIFALGGEPTTAEVACAIQDVARWWQ